MMVQNYTAVIQAGGKGTRLEALTKNKIPKPMLPLNGKPMIEWQINNIKKYGIKKFIIIIGHLGSKIQEYFGDGQKFGIQIQYIEEHKPLGSAGALYFLKSILQTSNFLFIFGDVMFDIDFSRMIEFHEIHNGEATLVVHPNAHPYDSDLLIVDHDYYVTGIHSKNSKRDGWYDNCVNAGIYILSSDILNKILNARKMDFEQDILKPLMEQKKVFGYCTPEYVKDAGTPERFFKVSREQKNGVWNRKNLENKQVCVFLDRDGTVNKYKGLIASEKEFELEDGVEKAICTLNEAGLLVIVVTNQPVVARGLCEIKDVDQIHRKMQTLLGEAGAYLDDIAFCPHHPDKGYPEENPVYKIRCNCRKPSIGMIEKMAQKYNINLPQSYMVGDSTVDIQTGKNAGMKTILVLTGQAGRDEKYSVTADRTVRNLEEAVSAILNS